MAFVHSKDGRVIINTAVVSADITSWTVTHERETSDTTGVGESGFRGTPGLMEGKMECEGLFNSAILRLQQTIDATVAVDNNLLVSIFPEGYTIGAPVLFGMCDTESYEVESSVKDAVTLNFEGVAHGMIDIGVSLHSASGSETTTGNSSSVDNLAASSNGAAAQLHVISAGGASPSLTVKVQHSTDNSVWVDLITFTAATGLTDENKEVAFGTTVNRYVRETHTISGTTPSFSYAVVFARR